MSTANSWAVHGKGTSETMSIGGGLSAGSGREHDWVDVDSRDGEGRDWWVGLAFHINR